MRAVVDGDEKSTTRVSVDLVSRMSRLRGVQACLLTAIRILAAIGRAQQARLIYCSPSEILVLEFPVVYAGHPRAITVVDVTPLDHEFIYHAMEW